MSDKIKLTASVVLGLIQGVFDEVDFEIALPDMPKKWQGKKLSKALNLEYFTFKRRPKTSKDIIADLEADGVDVNKLLATTRGFCSARLDGIERVYADDDDTAALTAVMTFWVQTSKIKLVEQLIEESSLATQGKRRKVEFGGKERQVTIVFGEVAASDILTATKYGEMATIEVYVDILITPTVTTYEDYAVRFTFNNNGTQETSTPLYLSNFRAGIVMPNKPVPMANNPSRGGSINLSANNTFALAFYGFNNNFVEYLAAKTLSGQKFDVNELVTMHLTRKDKTYDHELVIQEHIMDIAAGTDGETHSLTLAPRGIM